MADAFSGPIFSFRCPECGERFDVSRVVSSPEVLRSFRRIGCPHCGFSEIDAARGVKFDGSLSEGGTPFSRQTPKRWDVVALVGGAEAAEDAEVGRGEVDPPLLLKRVVGLPGEKLEIRGGELYADGKLLQKKRPIPTRLDQVRPVVRGDRIVLENRVPVPWLSEEKTESFRPKFIPEPILDRPSAFRLEPIPSGRLENVRDFILSFSLFPSRSDEGGRGSGDGGIADVPSTEILVNRGATFWRVCLDWKANRAAVYESKDLSPAKNAAERFLSLKRTDFSEPSRGEGLIVGQRHPHYPPFLKVRLEFFDRQAVLLVDEREILRINESESPESERKGEDWPIFAPFAFLLPAERTISGDDSDDSSSLAARFLTEQLRVGEVTVWRDVHYSAPESGRTVFSIPAGELFLLGDNSAVSIDSRQWKRPTLPVGNVRRIFGPGHGS